MKIFLISLMFFISLVLDGLVFPALFGFKESFLTIIFLVSLLLYWGVNTFTIGYGVSAALVFELSRGLSPGSIILPFTMLGVFYYVLSIFLNIKANSFSGFLLLGIFSILTVLTARILYGETQSFLIGIYPANVYLALYSVPALFVYLAIFRFINIKFHGPRI